MAPVSLQNEMNDLSARVGADAKREKEALGSSEPDSLCDALLFLAAFHNRAMTREALLFGLPIEDNRLSIPLFDRAARRAGLEVEPVERPLGEIPAFVLPAVLILQDQSARILSKIDTYRKKLTVINPSTREQTEVEAAALESDYLGHPFLVRRLPQASERLLPRRRIGRIGSGAWFAGSGRTTAISPSRPSSSMCSRSPRRCSP